MRILSNGPRIINRDTAGGDCTAIIVIVVIKYPYAYACLRFLGARKVTIRDGQVAVRNQLVRLLIILLTFNLIVH